MPSGVRFDSRVQPSWKEEGKRRTPEEESPTLVSPVETTSLGKLSGMDRLIYNMVADESGMIINGALLMKGKIMTRQDILDRVRERLVERHPRFRSRVDRASSTWHETQVDLRYHVKFTTLDRVQNLSTHLSTQVADTLDGDRPLWRVEIISTNRGEVVGITFRIHHVIGDGLSMMLLLYSMLDDAVDNDPFRDLPLGKRRIPLCLQILYWIRVLIYFIPSVLALAFRSSDRRNVLHVDSSISKCNEPGHVLWSKPLSLAAVKRLRKKARCSLNDCLSAVIAGAIRRYFEEIGESTDHDISCVIPVSVRSLGKKGRLRINNQVSSVFLRMPISIADPIQRVRILKRRMDALKYGATIWAVFVLTHLVALLPRRMGRYLNTSFMNKCSLIFSNVPGKSTRSAIVDNDILGVLGIVPLYGDVGTGVTCITYGGNAFLTLQAHAKMPRPELIPKFFAIEFAEMCRAFDCEPDFEDVETALELRQLHAGWLAHPSERSDYMKGLVPCFSGVRFKTAHPTMPSETKSVVDEKKEEEEEEALERDSLRIFGRFGVGQKVRCAGEIKS